jgi:cell division topological specificity factor
MTLLDFLQRLLGREKPSGTLARERLQLVLAHDRSDLNPELLEQMRREILEVVQKYVEIDLESGDVSLETGDRVTALVANLPIRRARLRSAAAPPAPQVGAAAETGSTAEAAPKDAGEGPEEGGSPSPPSVVLQAVAEAPGDSGAEGEAETAEQRG